MYSKIFIIGLPGSGKTFFGKQLAKHLKYQFLDTDIDIEELNGVKINEIFINKGEQHFRKLEQKYLLKLLNNKNNIVVATGGGMPIYEDNILYMKCNGLVIFLNTKPEIICNRLLVSDELKRPIFDYNSKLLNQILSLYKKRSKIYLQADMIVMQEDNKEIDMKEIILNMKKINKKINIAIDGYSATGKGTLAKSLANALKYSYIDTGAMYRAVTWYAIENKLIDFSTNKILIDELIEKIKIITIEFKKKKYAKRKEIFINDINVENYIRDFKVSRYVSEISKIHEVREKLVSIQKEMCSEKGVVMDGRDIASVVMQDAEIKFFINSDINIRAQRRLNDYKLKNLAISIDDVIKNIQERDEKDSNRNISPLKIDEEAIILINNNISIDEFVKIALDEICKKCPHIIDIIK